MRTVIIGAGEVGNSLFKVLSAVHQVHMRDKEDPGISKDETDILNICYPPSKDFVKITKEYIKQYNPKVTIIHSTVPVGTTKKCGEMVVHSPIHGKHPNLAQGILTYVKYLGGENPYAVHLARKFLTEAGIKVIGVANSETSELSKILCTTYYGWNLVFMKEVIKLCKKYKVPFNEVYKDWNLFYNQGVDAVGAPHIKRPIYDPIPGPIGGHCVINNCHLLDTDITNFILKKNEEYAKSM